MFRVEKNNVPINFQQNKPDDTKVYEENKSQEQQISSYNDSSANEAIANMGKTLVNINPQKTQNKKIPAEVFLEKYKGEVINEKYAKELSELSAEYPEAVSELMNFEAVYTYRDNNIRFQPEEIIKLAKPYTEHKDILKPLIEDFSFDYGVGNGVAPKYNSAEILHFAQLAEKYGEAITDFTSISHITRKTDDPNGNEVTVHSPSFDPSEVEELCEARETYGDMVLGLAQNDIVYDGIGHSFIDIKDFLDKLPPKNTEMYEFFFDSKYMDKMKQNSAGKYQDEFLTLFEPNKISITTLGNLMFSDLSTEDLLSSLKKMSKSTFKLAYDRPNQYLSCIDKQYSTPVDGKYPTLPPEELEKERAEIKKFFSENISTLARVLKYVDTDTISHMMDKRTAKFEESLKALNELSDNNMELLSNMLTCKSAASGKKLSPKEKMETCQIVEIFQKSKLDTSMLEDAVKNGEIDLQTTKDYVFDEVLKAAGIDTSDEQVQINKKKLNQDFSYLALINNKDALDENIAQIKPQMIEHIQQLRENEFMRDILVEQQQEQLNNPKMALMISTESRRVMNEFGEMIANMDNYTDEQILAKLLESVEVTCCKHAKSDELYTVIKEAVIGDFDKFVVDKNNKYGQANAQTKEIFESKGLNFEKWMKPDIEPIPLEIAGKKMTIRIWDRDPSEDLFMGNKTTCCTAIGTGGNAGATPIYLLNHSFNVVELFDENGNVVGMSRVFMADTDNKPSLIMDNIELNKTYIKGMSNEQKIEVRNGFFDYMNKYSEQVTGDKDSQVYFCSCDTNVPNYDLEHVNKKTDFIGAVSQDEIYINSANCAWIDPTKMPTLGKMEWLEVPKSNK